MLSIKVLELHLSTSSFYKRRKTLAIFGWSYKSQWHQQQKIIREKINRKRSSKLKTSISFSVLKSRELIWCPVHSGVKRQRIQIRIITVRLAVSTVHSGNFERGGD